MGQRGRILFKKSSNNIIDNWFTINVLLECHNLDAVKSLTKDPNNPVNSKIKLILSYSKNFQLDEVPDPYYGGQNGFDKVIDLLDDAIEGLIDSLMD